MRPVITACLLFGVTLLLYGYGIRSTPLDPQEQRFAEQASTAMIARPLFFHVGGEEWLQPAAIYAAAVLQSLAAGDVAGRVASTLIAAVNVVLLFTVVRMLTLGTAVALSGALLLILTPAHVWYAQLGTDAIFPVPVILIWIIAVLRFIQSDRPSMIGLSGLALGCGVYTHQTAPIIMALLGIATLSVLVITRRAAPRNLAMLAAGFLITLLPAALWFVAHPETYADTFGRWAILKAHARFPLEGLQAQMNWNTLSNRTSLFWGLLDPSFLLFTVPGRSSAPFLLCSAVLVPLGVVKTLASSQPAHRVLLLAAALVPPMVASTFGRPQDLSMAVAMTASAALLAAIGVESLRTRHRAWTWVAAIGAALSVLQVASLI